MNHENCPPAKLRWNALLATVVVLGAALADGSQAYATPARSNSLLDDPGRPDDTDIYVFPASLSLHSNRFFADLGPADSVGSVGIVYGERIALGVLLNRTNMGGMRLGVSDDLSYVLRTIRDPATLSPPDDQDASPLLPEPQKILDIFMSAPVGSPADRMGIGLSIAHASEERRPTPIDATDEFGLPRSISQSRKSRATLFAVNPSYHRTADSSDLEMSLSVDLSFFKVENRVQNPDPTLTPVDEHAEGTVLEQAGPPSFGFATRWRTSRTDSPVNWTVFGSADRRDYDSLDHLKKRRVDSNRNLYAVLAGPQWRPREAVLFSIMSGLTSDRLSTSRDPGPDMREAALAFPSIHASVECDLGKYLTLRGGAQHAFTWSKTRESSPVSGSGTIHSSSTRQEFNWAVGLAGHYRRFQVDVSVQPELLTQGPYLFGGPRSDGRGTGLFSLISLTYDFSHSHEQPLTPDDSPVDPAESN